MYKKIFNPIEIIIYITLIVILLIVFTLVIGSVNVENKNNSVNSITFSEDPQIINTSQEIIKKPYYNITSEERELLAKIVTLESSICSLECQKDVCSVIFNRLESGKWKKDMNSDGQITLYDIIYYPNAFSPVLYGMMDDCIPCDDAYKAVDYVITNGPTIPTYVRYFRTSYDFNWEGYENYKIIDNVYFGYFSGWQKGAW